MCQKPRQTLLAAASLHYITLSLFHTPFTPKVTSGASTKLCICQCKQMSFQLPFESTCISKFLESKRKIIPCFWSGMREASLTELALQYWKFISESVRRSESSSAGQISGCHYNVRQVGRSTANVHQMHKHQTFWTYLNLCRVIKFQGEWFAHLSNTVLCKLEHNSLQSDAYYNAFHCLWEMSPDFWGKSR